MNYDKFCCECKNPKEHNACEKYYIWNPTTCCCEKCEYLASSIEDSMVLCDDIINDADSVPKMLQVLHQQIFLTKN